MLRKPRAESAAVAGAAAVLLAGCVAAPPPPAPPVAPRAAAAPSSELGRAAGIIVVAARAGDTRAALAERFLGDRTKTQRVVSLAAPLASEGTLQPGEAIAISLDPRDPGGTIARPAQSVTILCYHRFTSRPVSTSTLEVTGSNLDLQMKYLSDHGYTVVTLGEVAEFLKGTSDLPNKPVVITVDDGYRSFYQIAFPIFRKYGFHSTLFAYSSFIGAGDALSWDQIQALERSGLVDVEGHSRTHADLTQRRRGESAIAYQRRVAAELDARELARGRAKEGVFAFAYPYGAANGAVLKEMSGAPWRLGLTVLRGGNPSWADPLLLRRDMIYGTDGIDDFARRLDAAASLVR